MSRSVYKMAGIYILVVSVFFILGGIFIPNDKGNDLFTTFSLVFGVILLVVGTVMYKLVKVEE